MEKLRQLSSVLVLLLFSAHTFAQLPLRLVAHGSQSGQVFGFSTCLAGDIDGDGTDDLAVGAPGTRLPGSGVPEGGVFILSGATGALLTQIHGLNQGDFLGWSLSGGVDLTLDGIPDLLVGAPNVDGAVIDEGAVYIWDVGANQLKPVRMGGTLMARLGTEVALLDDLDLDGIPDFALGAPNATRLLGSEGFVEIISGASFLPIRTHRGRGPIYNLGRSITRLGDINHDGIDDYAYSIPGWDPGGKDQGAVTVRSGATGEQIFRFFGREDFGQYGNSIAGLFNQDTQEWQLVIGSPTNSFIGAAAGMVEVRSLVDGSTLARVYANSALDRFGFAVADGGDLNGDRVDDILIGVTGDTVGGANSGNVTILSGADFSQIALFPGVPGSALGQSVAGLGDLNGDGFAEFAMGSKQAQSFVVQGSVAIASLMGVAQRPVVGATQTLVWNPGSLDRARGALIAAAQPGASCALISGNITSGLTSPILITPAQTVMNVPFTMPGSGTMMFPLNLRQPALAGAVFTTQLVTWPQLTSYSDGLDILFGE